MPPGSTFADVSPREAEVLALVGEHLTNPEIAARLFLSVRTVESHVSSLLRKLGVDDRRALAALVGSHQRTPQDPDPGAAPSAAAPTAPAVPTLRIRLLGEFRVSIGERDIAPDAWRLAKAQDVVKLLALAPHHRLHREQVLETLWPEQDPSAAANNMHQVLHAARRAIVSAGGDGHAFLRLQDEWLCLDAEPPPWVDVDAFDEAARDDDPARLREALALYAGELLPQDRYADWAEPRRDALRQRHRALLATLAGHHEGRGKLDGAAALLRRLLDDEPANEPAHRSLIRIYARQGDRTAAVRQFEALEQALRDELGVDVDSETRALLDDVLSGNLAPRTSPDASAPHVGTHLPAPLGTFVGRRHELAELPRALARHRLVTLTGTGGCGKTRLATEVARHCQDEFCDGVVMIELAPLDDSTVVGLELMRTLGVREGRHERPVDAVTRHLGDRHVLVVLDNCEHLIDAAADVTEKLLAACPRVAVLATSREPLRVPGEVVRRVPSLRLPDPTRAADPHQLIEYDAVRLFVERASAADAAFTLDETNAGDVLTVCRRLDGLPLALELAAARVPALAVSGLVARLDDRFRLLSGGRRTALSRQQTLGATVDWSYELLDEAHQTVLCRLAVFHDRFDLDAAEAVCAGEDIDPSDVALLVSELVERSMVVADGVEPTGRYRLLETIREYGAARLREAGVLDRLRDRHSRWVVALAERAAPELSGPARHAWLARLEAHRDDLRAASDHLRSADADAAVRLASLLWPYWLWHAYLSEGLREIDAALSRSAGPSPARVEAQHAALALSTRWSGVGRPGPYELVAGALGEARQLQDPRLESRALFYDGLYRYLTDFDLAADSFRAAQDVAHRAGLVAEEASALHARAVVAWHRQHLDVSRRLLHKARELAARLSDREGALLMLTLAPVASSRRLGERWLMWEETILPYQGTSGRSAEAYVLASLGNLERAAGREAHARARLEEALSRYEDEGDEAGMALAHCRLGQLALATGELAEARGRLERGLSIRERIGDARGSNVTLCALGHVAVEAGDLDRARRLLARAETMSRERGDLPALAEALARRGLLELTSHTTAAAIATFSEALELQRTLGVNLTTALAALDLADAQVRAGDLDAAVEPATEALEVFEHLGYRDEAARCRSILARARPD